jgi:hypothetical protein
MPLTRDQAVEIARRAALARQGEHNYLPVPTTVDRWMPHEWVIDAIVEASAGTPGTVVAELHEVVDRWVQRTAPRLKDDQLDYATIKLTLNGPGADDDGTLYVDFTVEEETSFTSERCNHGGGRVPGVEY